MRGLILIVLIIAAPITAMGVTTVCVDVQTRSWTDTGTGKSEAASIVGQGYGEGEAQNLNPYTVDPARYLGRMMQYEVTHHPKFESVESECEERLTVELYPLESGWTVFARYSGHTREEKVNAAQFDEFNALAERLATALLNDAPISDTINRQTVLRDDSEGNLRTIDGDGHLVLALGTELRTGTLATAGKNMKLSDERRWLTPMSVQLGYRAKFKAWAIDVQVRGLLGTSKRAPRRNPEGGHIDYDFGGALGLHFLRYNDAIGINSLYFGGGAHFELSSFSVIKPKVEGEAGGRTNLLGGGMSMDLILGYEFMRASTVHFFAQVEAHIPTYKLETEINAGGVDTYLPGGLVQIGVIF